ncbi:TRAP transporter small permease [Limnohabitans sp. Rim8]|uniref:TRAP transporter small permease n=1 Tax=Limnohabitans sp. Rim8 TaxID=1100718 RepID=UPI0025D5016D|nr:TRAP transporter small permease [Limnohabitans sp. Rim8]
MRFAQLLQRTLGYLAAAVLFLMMIVTAVDVVGRYFFNKPLAGGFEITEIGLALLIYCALPLVSARREHIVIDTFDVFMSPGVKTFLNRLSDVVCFVALSGVGYILFRRAVRVAEYGDTTNVLLLPLAPVVYTMSGMIVVAGLMHLVLIFIPHAEQTAFDSEEITP